MFFMKFLNPQHTFMNCLFWAMSLISFEGLAKLFLPQISNDYLLGKNEFDIDFLVGSQDFEYIAYGKKQWNWVVLTVVKAGNEKCMLNIDKCLNPTGIYSTNTIHVT